VPFTPYHFGPSGFSGLVFRKWIDLPVFVLANVVVDIEVLFAEGWPHHRHWHWHTFLGGGLVGIVWALGAYPLRGFFSKIMALFRLPYKSGLWKMLLSGVLGVWLHILIDSIYHYDVQPFWPWLKRNPIFALLGHPSILSICIVLLLAASVLYVLILNRPPQKENTTR